ncbi:hypothetical protein DY240_22770, partial [Jiangella rhizosphaerae]
MLVMPARRLVDPPLLPPIQEAPMTATSAPPERYVSRVRRLPVPVTEPPFDDEVGIVVARGGRRPPAGRPEPGPVQETLPLELEPDAMTDDLLRPVGVGEPAADSLWLRYPGPEPPALTPGPPAARSTTRGRGVASAAPAGSARGTAP